MTDPMAEIRASFFVECEELLEVLLDGLQSMEDGLADSETINVVFRAVHSIKGGAGAFGLDALVAFAHRFETALDELRSGRLVADGEVLRLFFTGSDILADLVRDSRDGNPTDDALVAPVRADLEALAATTAVPEADTGVIDFQPMALALDLDLDAPPPPQADAPVWQIRFRPEPGLYESGNEPLFLIRALRDLGALTVRCHDDAVPGLEAMANPEAGHIWWTLQLETTEGEAAIREVFDFVDGLCQLDIEVAPGGLDLPDLPQPEPTSAPEPEAAPALAAPPDGGAATAPKPASTPPGEADPRAAAATPAPRATVRVDLERIDRLVNLVGEIVINQAMLSQSVEAAGIPPNSPVRSGLEEFLQLTRDIQESVMMIRAQPVKSLFQRMARIVRETSAATGKEVRLRTEGENTEVDKTVIERLADPLTHMIRNAVDHGLEANDAREAHGKPREGTVSLRAMHRSGRIVIEIADDGSGIDRSRVLDKAIRQGLISADSQLSDTEIDNLLFLPGFSTADAVSNLSGRGVGMDVVRTAIQALGGRVSIASTRGKGTSFTISLPLTLAVLDGMVVRVAGETIVIPLSAILETLALGRDDVRSFGPSTHVVGIRDRFLPLLDLGAELGFRAPLEDYADQIVLLVGQEDGSPAAMVVDAIDDQRQVVIKGLHESYGRVPGIAAATILGDGQIALILDPIDLVSRAHGCTRRPPVASDRIANVQTGRDT
ncbi:chemotaxis protein CheA [Maritimibacter sp. HL-12]|uniref:chemotaxis protein CheA n=1 Tax=Maritimibacter sp. HL-12 TaxID=1162418 RepID=UPI000A0F2D6F|nr:chemotaxis protein CheA [Maritimibacter sp. HL-12]SMH56917.1 two-component system, chemotaxis family, sensor kinase CheA [Maritimibacter sp. HL-12]